MQRADVRGVRRAGDSAQRRDVCHPAGCCLGGLKKKNETIRTKKKRRKLRETTNKKKMYHKEPSSDVPILDLYNIYYYVRKPSN